MEAAGVVHVRPFNRPGEERIARVVGLAASVPFDKEHPRDPVNRRISIVVLDSDRPAGRTAARGVTAAAPPRAGSIATAALGAH